MIVGREPELKELAAAAAPVAGGRGSLVLIDGEAGIGKTRLVSELAGRLEGDGFAVAWSTCREGGAPPFWPWVQLLRRLPNIDPGISSGPLARLLSPPAEAIPGTDAQVDRFLLFDAVADELRAVGQPLLLVLEDLHWADEASLRLLAFLAGELQTVSALVVGTYRPGEVEAVDVTAMRPDRRIRLTGIAVGELNEAVEGLTGEPLEEPLLEPVHARTGGNPFFAVELVRLLRSEGRRTELIPSATLPDSVRIVLERRLARLPSGTHVLLRAAAVLGREFTLPAVASITAATAATSATGSAPSIMPPDPGGQTAAEDAQPEQPETTVERVAELLEPAIEARLVQPVGGRPGHLAFVHDLVRETLEAQLEVGERRDLHRRAGEVLLADAQDDATGLARAAHHLLEAAALGASPDQAIETAALAARRAMDGLAYEQALTLLSRALALLDAHTMPETGEGGRSAFYQLASDNTLPGAGEEGGQDTAGPGPPADRIQLLLDQGAAAVAAGSLEVARRAHLEAARLARQAGRVDDMARAALGLAAGAGGFEVAMYDGEQLALLEEVLRSLPKEDSELRAQVTARLSVALSFVEGDERRVALAAEALAMARRLGDPATLAASLAAHCDATAGPDHVRERLDEASEVLAIAEAQRNRPLELLGRRLRLIALAELGDWSGVDDEIVRYSLVANLVRQPLYEWYVPLWRGMRALMQGQAMDAEQFNQEVRRLARLSGSRNADLLADVQRFVHLVWKGDAAGGLEAVMQAVAGYDPAVLEQPDVPAMRGFALACEGRSQEARAVLDSALEDILAMPRDSEWLGTMIYGAHAAVLVGHTEAAARLYDTLAPYAGLFWIDGIGAGCWGSVDAYLGLLARHLGREAEAREHFTAAVDLDNRAGAALGERSRRWAELSVSELRSGLYTPPASSTASVAEVTGSSDLVKTSEGAGVPTFRLAGDVWIFGFGGRAVQARDAKGYHDIATLLQASGRPVHVADLVGGGVDPGSSGELVDRQALAAYRERLLDLEDDLAEAEAAHDMGRAEALQVERDMLVDELTSAAGLGGRPREATSQVERARKAVTNRVRHAIGRIERLHPELGRHLRVSVKTGTLCCYEPEHPVSWRL